MKFLLPLLICMITSQYATWNLRRHCKRSTKKKDGKKKTSDKDEGDAFDDTIAVNNYCLVLDNSIKRFT